MPMCYNFIQIYRVA